SDERPADQQIQDADQHGSGKWSEQNPVCLKPHGSREIDEPHAVQELDAGIPGECNKTPEHERVRESGPGTLANRAPLRDNVQKEAANTNTGVVEGEGAGSRENQANAGRDLREKGRDTA